MGSGREGIGEAIRRIGNDMEVECTRVIAYVNDDVVPAVRRRSSAGLRTAAAQLVRFANELDRGPHQRSSQASASRAAGR